jgi:hypothetical protein
MQTPYGAHSAFYTMTTGGPLPGSEAHAKPKNAWSYTSTPVYFTAYCLIENTENFMFTSNAQRNIARGTCQIWLRHYATSRKVEGSIPNEVTECFN